MAVIVPHTTRAPGTVLTASIYNADHVNHINNANALNEGLGGASPVDGRAALELAILTEVDQIGRYIGELGEMGPAPAFITDEGRILLPDTGGIVINEEIAIFRSDPNVLAIIGLAGGALFTDGPLSTLGHHDFVQIGSPGEPEDDVIRLYARDDDRMLYRTSAGLEFMVGSRELNLLDYIPASLHASILDNSITTDLRDYVQSAVDAAAGRKIRAPAGAYPLYSGVTRSGPINIEGDGNGCGPGGASIANSECTRFVLYFDDGDAFSAETNSPCYFEKFQMNTDPGSRPRVAGAGIKISGPSGSPGSTNANSRVRDIGMTHQFRGVHLLRPAYPEVTGCYFDSWIHAAILAETTEDVEGSAGFIHHNFFFGESGSVTQDSCILLGCGYVLVTHNEILGANYGVHIAANEFPVGFVRIFDNTIENQGTAGIVGSTLDGTGVGMLSIHRNEFSNVAFADDYVASIYMIEGSEDYLSNVDIAHNVHRHLFDVNKRFIWLQTGNNVMIQNEQFENLGDGTSTIGIDTSTFIDDLNEPIVVTGCQFKGVFGGGKYLTTAVTQLHDRQGLLVSQLPADAADGSIVFLSDGSLTVPIVGGEDGSLAIKIGGDWLPIPTYFSHDGGTALRIFDNTQASLLEVCGDVAMVVGCNSSNGWVGTLSNHLVALMTNGADRAYVLADGRFQFAAPSFAANGAGAVTITALRPAGAATATITRWLQFLDDSGVDSYIPVWQ
jgi:hypothetical protein